jgi:hypothetical protein
MAAEGKAVEGMVAGEMVVETGAVVVETGAVAVEAVATEVRRTAHQLLLGVAKRH